MTDPVTEKIIDILYLMNKTYGENVEISEKISELYEIIKIRQIESKKLDDFVNQHNNKYIPNVNKKISSINDKSTNLELFFY